MRRLFARRLYGPFLKAKDGLTQGKIKGEVLEAERNAQGVSARVLDPQKAADVVKLENLADGQGEDAVVFMTNREPDVPETLDGVAGYPGWKGDALPIRRVFSVRDGDVEVFDASLLDDSFEDAAQSLREHLANKK